MVFIPKYILILFALILVDYLVAFRIEESHASRRKAWLFLSLLANIGALCFFKYANFFLENIDQLAQLLHWNYSKQVLNIILPMGLSFHTFQSVSYTIEVYYGRYKAERNLLTYALYVLYYPQLVAGPIERPQNLLFKFHEDKGGDASQIISGIHLMFWGFFKKVFVADRLAKFVNATYLVQNTSNSNSLSLLIATYFFAFQIYCDFSGYTDIARGASKVMGIELSKNFQFPYHARSISDFWRRWHISLSTWFRDYLYIPLGGNRVGPWRHRFNLLFVFLISGFWHGANWTFIGFGGLHGIYMVLQEGWSRIWNLCLKLLRWNGEAKFVILLERVFVFHLVMLPWIFFRAESFTHAIAVIRVIGSFDWGLREVFLVIVNQDSVRAGILAIILLFIFERFFLKENAKRFFPRFNEYRNFYYCAICAFWLILILAGAPLNEGSFIYFQF